MILDRLRTFDPAKSRCCEDRWHSAVAAYEGMLAVGVPPGALWNRVVFSLQSWAIHKSELLDDMHNAVSGSPPSILTPPTRAEAQRCCASQCRAAGRLESYASAPGRRDWHHEGLAEDRCPEGLKGGGVAQGSPAAADRSGSALR